jgi:uncharacterized protein (UPF0335 family)
MSGIGDNSGDARLLSFIERIETQLSERDAIMDGVKEIYAEAKSEGYDKTAMGALIAERRKQAKNPEKFNETESVLDLYRAAVERASSRAHTHTRAGDE